MLTSTLHSGKIGLVREVVLVSSPVPFRKTSSFLVVGRRCARCRAGSASSSPGLNTQHSFVLSQDALLETAALSANVAAVEVLLREAAKTDLLIAPEVLQEVCGMSSGVSRLPHFNSKG